MRPDKAKAAPARTAPSEQLTLMQQSYNGTRARRNAGRTAGSPVLAGSAAERGADGAAAALPPAAVVMAADVRGAWVEWLAPHFANGSACYFTGTYSDEYGIANGLMLARNVHKDWRRFLKEFQYEGEWIVGVEQHRYRDILHLHAILDGDWTEAQRLWVKRWWQIDRGYAKALPVLDGCASYVTKYALKGDTDSFEWFLR